MARAVTRAGLIDLLAARIGEDRRGRPVLVAIDGPDAAGKTTLADDLAAALRARGRQVVRASADAFLRPRDERYARGPLSAEGYYHDSVDEPALARLLLDPLGPGGTRVVRTGLRDAATDAPLTPEPVHATDDAILVCDGIFLLRPRLAGRWDVRVFVDAAFDVRLRRALVRDLSAMGSAQAVEERYRTRYEPGQALYRAQARPEAVADVVVQNDDPAAPRVRERGD